MLKLFDRIDQELEKGRFVIISFRITSRDSHMYVIYRKNKSDYDAFTKEYCKDDTSPIHDVKDRVRSMGVTDILVYSL